MPRQHDKNYVKMNKIKKVSRIWVNETSVATSYSLTSSVLFHSRWRNWVIRGFFTFVMITSFLFIVYLGPLALVVLVSSLF